MAMKHPSECCSENESPNSSTTSTSCAQQEEETPLLLNGKKREKKTRITYITDIEGDGEYFDRFVETSKILAFEPVEPVLTCYTDKNTKGEGDEDTEDEYVINGWTSTKIRRSRNNRRQKNSGDFCSIAIDYFSKEEDSKKGENYYTTFDYFPYDKHVVFKDNNKNDDDDQDDDVVNMLVCGGDMWDKGGADLYVTRQLISLQSRYGKDRVHFILGNRDINKMRILEEIGFADPDYEDEDFFDKREKYGVPTHGGVYWLRFTKQTGDPKLIEKIRHLDSRSTLQYANILLPESSVARLKWILKFTMGSPDAFELRRGELKREKIAVTKYLNQRNGRLTQNPDDVVITDEEVVDSYRLSCHPINGVMGEFIRRGKLALKIGGVMFVHGALPVAPHLINQYKTNMDEEKANGRFTDISHIKNQFWEDFFFDAMPWLSEKHRNTIPTRIQNADSWANALNSFVKSQTQVWEKLFGNGQMHATHKIWATEGGYHEDTAAKEGGKDVFGGLIQYGMDWLPKDNRKNPSAVYSTWFVYGEPRKFFGKKVQDQTYAAIINEFFDRNDLNLMLTGHQPSGDMPYPIQVGANILEHKPTCSLRDAARRLSSKKDIDKKPKFIIAADGSYAANVKWLGSAPFSSKPRLSLGRGEALSFRGDAAVSEVLVDLSSKGEVLNVTYHGVLSDGSSYETTNIMDKVGKEAIVGKVVDQERFHIEGIEVGSIHEELNWIVKAERPDGSLIVSASKGRDVYNSIAWKSGSCGHTTRYLARKLHELVIVGIALLLFWAGFRIFKCIATGKIISYSIISH